MTAGVVSNTGDGGGSGLGATAVSTSISTALSTAESSVTSEQVSQSTSLSSELSQIVSLSTSLSNASTSLSAVSSTINSLSTAVSSSISTALSTATSEVTSLSTAVGGASRLVLLGKLTGADFNSVNDQAIALTQPGSGAYVISAILITNVSTSLTTAKGTFYAATGKTNIIPPGGATTTPYTGLVAVTDGAVIAGFYINSPTTSLHFSRFTSNTTIYLSLTTAQGGAATADIYVFGYDLS